ncbi:MinD/ParA family protein [Pseudoxanthomonas winnipegensis]|uniref:MinD/ParA family protein n=1 Tax=Pseudoxanthomonas winnipegensis TaxID=2480810 RepID=A0A4Q8LPT3_9GAMM|nr:MinD/ParA family protein [Pseudoxanthomonas winnipegensis]RZZ89327.1 MinD/ParA family protein [Pseudoxanthomonas winnipegensis]TAA33227.1 MinD/ParA family protein [Pseudoxanthomonas winnipegensis]TAA44186.1 MinD/ParA family protein [Pseudoxanthomonas winnipegensis]TBV72162.1 MinD/ParA family protein [Pseudoxanthomonas winnipegensis]
MQSPDPRAPRIPRVIAVASGKGGVGKTTTSINLAAAMVNAGQRTLLLDTDLGLANADVMLGLSPRFTLADVFAVKCTLADTLLEGPGGLLVVPAASGKQHMAQLSPAEHTGLIHAFSELDVPLDVMVIDNAAGIADGVLTFCQAAHDVVVVVCDEPASMTDAYALIKVLGRDRGVRRVHVLANQVGDATEGPALFAKLERVVGRFLDITLNYLGAVPRDEWLRRAVQRQEAVVDAFPSAPSAIAFRDMARRARQWQQPTAPRGHVEFFLERLVGQPAQGSPA